MAAESREAEEGSARYRPVRRSYGTSLLAAHNGALDPGPLRLRRLDPDRGRRACRGYGDFRTALFFPFAAAFGGDGAVVRNTRTLAVIAILAAFPILAGCSGGEQGGDGGSQADGQRPAGEQTVNGQTGDDSPSESERATHKRSGDTEARAGGDAVARAGNAVVGAGKGAENRTPGTDVGKEAEDKSRRGGGSSQKVVLEVEGSDDKMFTGTCSVGSEERQIGGQAPERYTFRPDGRRLECHLREDGRGTLKLVLTAGDDVVRSVQQSGAGESNVSLTYSGDGVSVTQFSSSGSVN
jgi:hypothetical protein